MFTGISETNTVRPVIRDRPREIQKQHENACWDTGSTSPFGGRYHVVVPRTRGFGIPGIVGQRYRSRAMPLPDLPFLAKAFHLGVPVLGNDRSDAFRMFHGEPQAYRLAIVKDVERIAGEAKSRRRRPITLARLSNPYSNPQRGGATVLPKPGISGAITRLRSPSAGIRFRGRKTVKPARRGGPLPDRTPRHHRRAFSHKTPSSGGALRMEARATDATGKSTDDSRALGRPSSTDGASTVRFVPLFHVILGMTRGPYFRSLPVGL
jgi:hypothetical protein